jgi:hypothetical protein
MPEVFISRQPLVNRQSKIIATRLTLHPQEWRPNDRRSECAGFAGRVLAAGRKARIHQ